MAANRSMYQDPRNQFGEISHQATVVIQCRQDKSDIVNRMKISNGNESVKKDYHLYGAAKATLDSSITRIDRGDIVFQVGTSSIPRGNMMNNAPPVASFLNGLAVRKYGKGTHADLTEDQVNEQLSQGIRYMGIALGATEPNPEGGEEQQKMQITVRTQGTMSIFNNGRKNIVPGDTLLWKIPTELDLKDRREKDYTGRYGRAPQKVVLAIEPLTAKTYQNSIKKVLPVVGKDKLKDVVVTTTDEFAFDIKKLLAYTVYIATVTKTNRTTQPGDTKPRVTFDEVWDFFKRDAPTTLDSNNNIIVNSGNVDLDTAVQEVHEAMGELVSGNGADLVSTCLQGFLKVQSDIDRRKIGKALSYSKVGQKVDVLLGCS